jgi:hypothetical protein
MLMLKSVSSKEFDLPKQLQVLWRREIQSVCVCASVALLMRRYASGRVRYVGLCTGSTCVPRHAQYGALFQFLKVLKCSQGTLTPTIWCDMCNRISKLSMKLGPVKLLRLGQFEWFALGRCSAPCKAPGFAIESFFEFTALRLSQNSCPLSVSI